MALQQYYDDNTQNKTKQNKTKQKNRCKGWKKAAYSYPYIKSEKYVQGGGRRCVKQG